MGTLILVRHGQSQWNLENRFTGWTDIPLTAQGEKDAELCGASLSEFHFDMGFVSRQQRSQKTLEAILRAQGQNNIPTVSDSALNERHYGDLQGLNKAETIRKYGEEQVRQWRRSYTIRPPNGESIEDCVRRTVPFFREYILKEVAAGKTVIVAAHGNSLRPIIMHLDGLTGEQAAALEIPFCVPYVYSFDGCRMTGKEIREVPGMEVKSTAKIG
ncbi:2,3-diphosphoglycerate-dependent phosphoglycerate mutase [Candidatus Peregrinibacteria bacterium]|nr:2,3-diphosphoglycerate-dependent phosphoglycerate mutase [Candidatus Peregrinibacteria bacterium]